MMLALAVRIHFWVQLVEEKRSVIESETDLMDPSKCTIPFGL